MEKILISACLLGQPVRYDGKSKNYPDIDRLADKYILIPVCPEIYGGLPTPRDPSEIVNDQVLTDKGVDVTPQFIQGAKNTLDLASTLGIKAAILKSKSPSCGTKYIYNGSFDSTLTEGMGITAKLLLKNGITLYSEEDIPFLLSR